METRILGRTGLAVGVIGLGTEQMAIEAANMDAVIDLGYRAASAISTCSAILPPVLLRNTWRRSARPSGGTEND